ncbi:MAG: DegT/DnrJ/EryC1/StrS aminotransferase family protein, partial [Deltaproteobacteria bacterium]|nr:DegT/DnrJ/EryC1/StrS aminotransferase family protein [Deltaproteobacteria bacterium]
MKVPFFRPDLREDEVNEVADTLRSGWLTTGPKVKRFEERFAQMVGAKFAVALNSCTAGLHLALEALGVEAGDVVLVPTHTFAATAEVVRYMGAHPLLIDCDVDTCNMDLQDASAKIQALRSGELSVPIPKDAPVVGIMPVHVGG